jgi:hypothetical protein
MEGKRASVRFVACIFSGLLLALGAAPLAHAATLDSNLLRMYQPVAQFDPSERFGPTAVQSFISDSALEQLVGGQWVVVDPDPGPGALPGPGSGTFRLNQTACSPAPPPGGAAPLLADLSCYQAGWDEGSGASVVYGRVAHLSTETVLQYWYFYYDDLYTYYPLGDPRSDLIWQAHEGDWEVVNVVLAGDQQPVEAAYSQHCLGQRRDWAATPRWNETHPVVYVALGSHANYFTPGTHQINVDCVPAQVLAALAQNGLSPPVDYSSALGATAGPPHSAGRVTTIHSADESVMAWLRFPGAWGELNWIHVASIATVPVGSSPVGPAYHDVWEDPLAEIATWPLG